MFYNLVAEQARLGLSNKDVAKYLGMNPSTYSAKKISGKFTMSEIYRLCKLFKKDFHYLFDTEKNPFG